MNRCVFLRQDGQWAGFTAGWTNEFPSSVQHDGRLFRLEYENSRIHVYVEEESPAVLLETAPTVLENSPGES